jgi:hypothetical protein
MLFFALREDLERFFRKVDTGFLKESAEKQKDRAFS